MVRISMMRGCKSLSWTAVLMEGLLKRPAPWIRASFQRVLLRRRKEKSSQGVGSLAMLRWRTWPRERREASIGRVTRLGCASGVRFGFVGGSFVVRGAEGILSMETYVLEVFGHAEDRAGGL